ncbi:unnamed protein product, partial [Rotaria sp. Silwood1]
MEVKVPTRKGDNLSLNSDHTHFIIIREKAIGSASVNVGQNSAAADSGERQFEKLADSADSATNRFRERFENSLHQEALQQQATASSNLFSPTTDQAAAISSSPAHESNLWNEGGFPMVCTLVRGTLGTIKLLHKKIHEEIPVVILRGTGSAADIIAFAYEEIHAKSDKEFEDSYLKVELTQRLLDEYPALIDNHVKRNEIRDHVIAIVKKADQGRRKFLTFVDVKSAIATLKDFHKFILSALIESQKVVIKTRVYAQMRHNLTLILDWNLPDLALSKVFQHDNATKYSIPHYLFAKAVLGKNLETFVDIFLDNEFILHRYLTSDELFSLFHEAKDREFLTATSFKGVLGITEDTDEISANFVERRLNPIMKRLTGIKGFFRQYEMDCNASSIYFCDKTDKDIQRQRIKAEKKAIRYLITYAVLMNRHQLAKILWKRSLEPIPMALICYMIFKKLAIYCHDSTQRLQIEKQAKEFSDYAVGVLEKSFNEDQERTLAMLNEKNPDWNHMATFELAYRAENKEFMVHPAYQKLVTRRFYNEITLRELSFGLFKCPDYLKRSLFRQLTPCFRRNQHKSTASTNPNDKSKNTIEQIKTLWNAPITKFYTNFVAYLVYLSFFTLAVMWPSCGNLWLDCFVWLWTASIAFENTRVAYLKFYSQNILPLQRDIPDVIVQTIFLALYLSFRILGLWNFG